MSNSNAYDEQFIKRLAPEERKQFKEKLIERITQIQTSAPWDENRPDYDKLNDLAFQELCHLLNIVIFYEKLTDIPSWPSKLKQQYPRKFKGFRIFVTRKVHDHLNSELNNSDREIFRKAIEMALGNYPRQVPAPESYKQCQYQNDRFNYYESEDGMSLHAAWSKPTCCDDWEGFALIAYRGSPEISYLDPQKPESMEEFFKLCLELPVS